MEISLEVQPNDLTGTHRDGEPNLLERQQVSEDEDKVVADGTSHADQGRILFFKPRLGWTPKHFKSPLAISNWRCFGKNEGQQQRVQIGEETSPFKQISGGTRKQQHKSLLARTLRSASISEGRRRPSKTGSSILADEG